MAEFYEFRNQLEWLLLSTWRESEIADANVLHFVALLEGVGDEVDMIFQCLVCGGDESALAVVLTTIGRGYGLSTAQASPPKLVADIMDLFRDVRSLFDNAICRQVWMSR